MECSLVQLQITESFAHIENRDIQDTWIQPEQIKHGSTGSMLQEHFMISGTFESETHTNKQPDFIINKIYEYHSILSGKIPIKAF